MSLGIRKLISAFFFLAFLFSLATEISHAHEHLNETHCTEQSVTHFHPAEHHCFICDYVQAASGKPAEPDFVSIIPHFTREFFSFREPVSFEQHNFNFSLRGPPAVA